MEIWKDIIEFEGAYKVSNLPENLEWCTQAYNNAYGSRSIGRTILKMDLFGNIIEKYCSLSDAANRNSKDKKTIYRWCLKMNKTKAGFVWAFGD